MTKYLFNVNGHETQGYLLGIPLCDYTAPQVEQWIKVGQIESLQYCVTPNVDHLVRYVDSRDTLFVCAYRAADIAILDSRVLQLVSRFFHGANISFLPGSDLTEYLFNSGVLINRKVAIIGGDETAITHIKERYHLQKLFHHYPPMGFINSPDAVKYCIEFVTNHRPEVLFLAVGSPRQEILAYRLKQEVDFPCKAFCIGASIDFLIGKEKRAPLWMQKLALEWLYRFIKDPKGKFRRYFIDGLKILPLIFRKDFIITSKS
ncbi:WecB/TagA/CpsF family glycosyltransferase [Endozoicomonas acroporae]|uniref:WecB/TagA/CpsF family glycosyltransferase n=1 Tax=Endozoicomonas acroporae TaxID=1701104 RepID=UPI003D7B7A08